jgi:hypothetical protein
MLSGYLPPWVAGRFTSGWSVEPPQPAMRPGPARVPPSDTTRADFGLQLMADAARRAGAGLTVTTPAGEGTALRLEVPRR